MEPFDPLDPLPDLESLRLEPSPRPAPLGLGLFRHAFVPGIVAVSVASWLYQPKLDPLHVSAHNRAGALTVLLLSIVWIWSAEQMYPEKLEWNYNVLSQGMTGWSRLGRDLIYFLVITQVSTKFIDVVETRLKPAMAKFGFGLDVSGGLWPSRAPFVVRILLAFLLVELCSYWLHRACHRFGFLWRFHSTHHVITELTALKAFRTHPVENVFFYVVRTVPLMLLGAGADEVVALTSFRGVLSVLAHSNIQVSEGVLGYVINFPSYHSVHHSSDALESKSNFGCHTVLWDRLFGTFRSAPQGTLEVGVKPVGTRSLWRELVWPFYRSVS
jgi:sterol desaturase/sphingolipid hydroxylase (fatty acid hydroxylase superfamily)